jgi:hypothetical protein
MERDVNAVSDKVQPGAVELALVAGDLGKLNAEQRLEYYRRTCDSLGLNPLTQPFEYITLNNKLKLYARKDCTEQLRTIRKISVKITAREVTEGCYVVTAQALTPEGRQDESIGSVPIDGLKGEARSNAMMKAETKAKRRVTLSICGLGILDEMEVDSIPGARFNQQVQHVPQADQPAIANHPNGNEHEAKLASLRNELGDLIRKCAALKKIEPDAVFFKLLQHVRGKFPAAGGTSSEWDLPPLTFAISATKASIADAEKTADSQPGEEATEVAAKPAEPITPVQHAQQMMLSAGVKWPALCDASPKIFGRALPRGSYMRDLSEEDLVKVVDYCQKVIDMR